MKAHEDKAVEEYLEALLCEGEISDDIREILSDPDFDRDWDADNGMSLTL